MKKKRIAVTELEIEQEKALKKIRRKLAEGMKRRGLQAEEKRLYSMRVAWAIAAKMTGGDNVVIMDDENTVLNFTPIPEPTRWQRFKAFLAGFIWATDTPKRGKVG